MEVHVIYDKDFEVWKFQLSECQRDMVSNQWRGSNDFEVVDCELSGTRSHRFSICSDGRPR